MRLGPLGTPELLILLLVVILVFGAKRLPEVAKGLGQSVRAFRSGIKDLDADEGTSAKPQAKPGDEAQPKA